MTVRQGLIVIACLMISNVAHAESSPSNAELFEMLKSQQQTISELRAELKQMKQERAAIASQRGDADTAPKQVGRVTSTEPQTEAVATATPMQAPATYIEGPAAPSAPNRGAYASLFGGGGSGGSSSTSQLGTVFYAEAAGGPLAVDATGQTNSSSVGFIGTQIGYEWAYRSRLLPEHKIDLLPALEIEGFYLSSAQHNATLQNPNVRLAEQTFEDSFSTSTAVILANAVVGIRTPYQSLTPYIGGGIGAARITIDGATSTQTNPLEPGINHFNSIPDSVAWTFAAQAKAGVRYAFSDNAYLFGEYRYLYVGAVEHSFGSTVYPGHAATTAWTVRSGDTYYNLMNAGVGVSF